MEIHDVDDDHLRSVLQADEGDEEPDGGQSQEFSASTLGSLLMQPSTATTTTTTTTENNTTKESGTWNALPDLPFKSTFNQTKRLHHDTDSSEGVSEQQQPLIVIAKNTGGDKQKIANNEEEEFSLADHERQLIPDGMITPRTKRLNDIILMTAARTSAAPQFEVLLKLKQAGNAEFAFLRPGHTLHPYYFFLKERGGKIDGSISVVRTLKGGKEESNDDNNDKGSQERGKDSGSGAALSGLVDMYSSSSDDEDDEAESSSMDGHEGKSENKKFTDAASNCLSSSETKENEEKRRLQDERRAKRLKRAKNLKGHFALKLMEQK